MIFNYIRSFALLPAVITVVLFYGQPAYSQIPGETVLDIISGHPKLKNGAEIIADFRRGVSEVQVIVALKPSPAGMDLAGRSRLGAKAPSSFDRAGAPVYFNLQDSGVRRELRETVEETVSRVVDKLGSAGKNIAQRFTYQFGFAAKVTPVALELILNEPNVLSVEPDPVLKPHLAQGIPLIQGAAPRAQYDGSGVSIAICDTGIDTSHPRLGGGGFPNAKVIGGYDTGDRDADPRPHILYGDAHGTSCAGIAAGNTGTVGDYIGGVAPGAKLYALKISVGNTGSASGSALIAAWEWAITHQNDDPANPIMIISTSFGGDGAGGRFTSVCDSYSSGMTTAAANAVAAGITIFASAGNDGYCDAISWPACISYVNAVGAVYDANIGTYYPCVSPFSCAPKTATSQCTGWYAADRTGPDMVTSYSNSSTFLRLLAPANKAYTTDIVGAGGYASGSYFSSFGGTSASCPYAAGAAAVLQSAAKARQKRFLSPEDVQNYLVSNGDHVVDTKNGVRKPRINLKNSVSAVQPISTTAPLFLLFDRN